VKVVKVSISIPKVGDIILTLACYEGRVVALETKGELVRRECARISFHTIGSEEQFSLGSGVGAMAIGAVTIRDGRVDMIVVLTKDLVAFAAQCGLVAQEQGTVFRCVGSVAIGAAAVRDRLMNHGTAVDHAVVAFLAKPLRRTGQKFGAVGRMGVVAGQAAVLIDDTVKLALHKIIVALSTQIGSGLEKKGFVLRGVRIVTVNTSSVGGCLVRHCFRCGIVVALKAQAGYGFDEKRSVGRSVGIMACVASVILDDGVKGSHVSWIIVAFDAKAIF